MSLAALRGGFAVPYGIGQHFIGNANPQQSAVTLDAANEAAIFIGQIITADGGSHTIDTSGSSSLQWRSDAVTFANAGTTVVVGLAAVDAANGPPARAANSTDVITFDVSRSMTGGGGGVTSAAWQSHAPTSGSKSIANGDFVAFAVQMTARGGSDTVAVSCGPGTGNTYHYPMVTSFLSGVYNESNRVPQAIVVFSDGTRGWFYATDVFNAISTRTFNSGSATKEYGQLYSPPFPCRVHGLYGWADPDADYEAILYSDPLGTPVAEKTVSIDANVVAAASGRKFYVLFPSPFDLRADTPVAAVFKPGGSSISAYYKTLNNAADRVTDPGGTSSYGVSRASGAFANANSSLDHYYIGLMLGGFEHGVPPTFALGV